jgi:hypothetical protein
VGDLLQVYGSANNEYSGYTNLELISGYVPNQISLEDEDSIFSPPIFIIFSEDPISDYLLKDSNNISFKSD